INTRDIAFPQNAMSNNYQSGGQAGTPSQRYQSGNAGDLWHSFLDQSKQALDLSKQLLPFLKGLNNPSTPPPAPPATGNLNLGWNQPQVVSAAPAPALPSAPVLVPPGGIPQPAQVAATPVPPAVASPLPAPPVAPPVP